MTRHRISAAVRRDAPLFLFMAMEMAWIAVTVGLLQALMKMQDGRSVAWTLGLYPVTWLFYRLERRWPAGLAWKLPMRAVCAALALVLSVAAIVRPGLIEVATTLGSTRWAELKDQAHAVDASWAVLVALFCLFAMARGWILGSRQMDGRGFLGGFYLGLGMLFLCVFGQHLAGLPATDMLPGVIAFLAFGLYGLGANRWLRTDVAARTASQAGWPVLGVAVIALILFVGVVFWTHLDRHTVDLVLAPVLWLWDMVVRLFAFLVSLLPKSEPVAMPPPAGGMPALPQAVREEPFDWGETVRSIGKFMFFTSVGFLLFWALLRNLLELLLWLSRRLGRSQGISFEHSSAGFLSDLRSLLLVLAGLLSRLWSRVASLLRGRDDAAMAAEVRDVRRIYRGLLIWACRRGWPKPLGQTPYEFLDHLRGTLPQIDGDLALITRSYVAVRYGSALPSPEAVRAVRASWRRVRKVRKRKAAP